MCLIKTQSKENSGTVLVLRSGLKNDEYNLQELVS
jgi:hypothetical protein